MRSRVMSRIDWHADQIYTAIRDKDMARAREARIYARKSLDAAEHHAMELTIQSLAEQNRKPPTYFK